MHKKNTVGNSAYRIVLLLILFTVTISGCYEVQFIAQYDEDTLKLAESCRNDIEALLTKMESSINIDSTNKYQDFKSDYDSLRTKINTLHGRASSKPKNNRTTLQIERIQGILAFMESVHKGSPTLFELLLLKKRIISLCDDLEKLNSDAYKDTIVQIEKDFNCSLYDSIRKYSNSKDHDYNEYQPIYEKILKNINHLITIAESLTDSISHKEKIQELIETFEEMVDMHEGKMTFDDITIWRSEFNQAIGALITGEEGKAGNPKNRKANQ